MPKKRETRRQQRVRQALEEAFPGSYWRKVWGGPFQHAGIADILGCCQGLFFAFEVKEPDGGPSELQLDEIDEVREAGGCSCIIIEPEEAVRQVRKALTKHGKIKISSSILPENRKMGTTQMGSVRKEPNKARQKRKSR